ncbi:hypothetical protein [uncultured Robinsoniella sp.]|uniref:hypothetical protein n=1 Tax=uncultured Robinsoniella sp. TaxID=904190 RepID=UPI00374F24D9
MSKVKENVLKERGLKEPKFQIGDKAFGIYREYEAGYEKMEGYIKEINASNFIYCYGQEEPDKIIYRITGFYEEIEENFLFETEKERDAEYNRLEEQRKEEIRKKLREEIETLGRKLQSI